MERVSLETEAKYPETCELVRHMLDVADFKTLYEIFGEYLEKSDVSRDRMNLDCRFYFDESLDDRNALMTYAPTANAIRINIPYLDRILGDPNKPSSLIYGSFISDLAHEFTHVFSRIRHERTDNDDPDNPKHRNLITAGGLQEVATVTDARTGERLGKRTWNSLFMEGVTELISHEVAEEYARRSPLDPDSVLRDSKPNLTRFLAEQNIAERRNDYSVAQRFVIALTDAIAERVGVSQEVVWRAVERQYFSGELKPFDFTGHFDELFGDGFAKELSDADDALAITNLALRFKEISAKYPEAVEKWLGRLDLTRGAKK